MKIIFSVSLLLLNLWVQAQESTNQPDKIDSLTSVRVEARINGGQETWRHFLEKNIHPQVPADHGAKPGRYIVTVSFLVDTTGKVSDVQILNDPGYGTAADVLKAFKHCPDWIPATINGKPVLYRQKQNIYYEVSQ